MVHGPPKVRNLGPNCAPFLKTKVVQCTKKVVHCTTLKKEEWKLASDFIDPRPDLQDSCRWIEFFKIINHICPKVLEHVQGIRAQGTEFGWTKQGKPRLVPLVDWNGWASEKDYAQARDKYLRPYQEEVVTCLNYLLGMVDILPPGIHEKESPWPSITGAKVYVARDQYARERMHTEHSWVWVFNKGEVLDIAAERDIPGVLQLRGKTGTFFATEKRKENWNAYCEPGGPDDQGVPEAAKGKSHTVNQDFGW